VGDGSEGTPVIQLEVAFLVGSPKAMDGTGH
jgi:hypothetical protein